MSEDPETLVETYYNSRYAGYHKLHMNNVDPSLYLTVTVETLQKGTCVVKICVSMPNPDKLKTTGCFSFSQIC